MGVFQPVWKPAPRRLRQEEAPWPGAPVAVREEEVGLARRAEDSKPGPLTRGRAQVAGRFAGPFALVWCEGAGGGPELTCRLLGGRWGQQQQEVPGRAPWEGRRPRFGHDAFVFLTGYRRAEIGTPSG